MGNEKAQILSLPMQLCWVSTKLHKDNESFLLLFLFLSDLFEDNGMRIIAE